MSPQIKGGLGIVLRQGIYVAVYCRDGKPIPKEILPKETVKWLAEKNPKNLAPPKPTKPTKPSN